MHNPRLVKTNSMVVCERRPVGEKTNLVRSKMSKPTIPWVALGHLAGVLLVCIAAALFSFGERPCVSRSSFDKINDGMDYVDVEALFGRPPGERSMLSRRKLKLPFMVRRWWLMI